MATVRVAYGAGGRFLAEFRLAEPREDGGRLEGRYPNLHGRGWLEWEPRPTVEDDDEQRAVVEALELVLTAYGQADEA